jgi:isocitrate dehydrogenase
MLLRHLGWGDAAHRLEGALARVLASGRVTADLASPDAREVLSTEGFGRAVTEECSGGATLFSMM